MLTLVKYYLKLSFVPLLYIGGLLLSVGTIFKKAEWGLLLMIIIIPQPNILHKFHDYPFGKDFIDILFVSTLLGIFVQKLGFEKTSNTFIIILITIVSYIALFNSSFRFSLPLPVSRANILLPDWKNYTEMILLYFLALNIAKTEEKQKLIVTVMAAVMLFIFIRSYRNFSAGGSFSFDKRVGGPFETVGLGPNHFGAFVADYAAILLGLFIMDKSRVRWLYLAAFIFGLHPLFYSYSRGAYLAFIAVVILFGLIKKRSLLVMVVVLLLTWQTVLPASVVDRISMTQTESGELEGSAAHRLPLWDHALALFKQNPVFGVGFGGFGYTVSPGELTDTHNYYIKMLAEQGLIGFLLFLGINFKALLSGIRLYKVANTAFYKGLGLGFIGCVLSMIVTNMFGDRWSYFPLGAYFWLFFGFVDRAILVLKNQQAAVS